MAVYFNDVLGKPGLSLDDRVYVLLDEVQYIENWQAILKRYYDLSGKQIKFIVTGSQSMLLRGKRHESLAGRIFDFYLPPMSFREFLRINHQTVKIIEKFDLFELPKSFGALGIYNADFNKKISQLSREYLISGQFPEINQIDTPARKHEYILEAVIGKVLEDCIKIFKIEKTDAFKLIARQLINNAGSIFELKNISREAGVSFETLDKYIEPEFCMHTENMHKKLHAKYRDYLAKLAKSSTDYAMQPPRGKFFYCKIWVYYIPYYLVLLMV